jgi:hypothetical protein
MLIPMEMAKQFVGTLPPKRQKIAKKEIDQ